MRVTTIGVLDDDGGREFRVALVPDGVRRLGRQGLSVMVEAGAGAGASYPDTAYTEAGATVGSREQVVGAADVLLTVSKVGPDDVPLLHHGQVLIGLLSTPSEPALIERLAGRGVTALSLEYMPRTLSRAQSMDVLTSQASVAGYKAVLVAANAFGRYFPMLITAAGTSRPASVLVLGAGVAGLSAIGTARRLGAVVTGYDVRPESRGEVESLGAKFLELTSVESAAGTDGYARALTEVEQKNQQAELESHLPSFDVIITTAAVPGRRPPLLIPAGALARMRPGSVVVDMGSGPLGGNVEDSVPGGSTVTANGVTVVGAPNLAASVPTAASDAFSQNMLAMLGAMIKDGELEIDLSDEVQSAVVITHDGQLISPAAVSEPARTESNMEDPGERVAAI